MVQDFRTFLQNLLESGDGGAVMPPSAANVVQSVNQYNQAIPPQPVAPVSPPPVQQPTQYPAQSPVMDPRTFAAYQQQTQMQQAQMQRVGDPNRFMWLGQDPLVQEQLGYNPTVRQQPTTPPPTTDTPPQADPYAGVWQTVEYKSPDGKTYYIVMPFVNTQVLPEGASLLDEPIVNEPERVRRAEEEGEKGGTGNTQVGLLSQMPQNVQILFTSPQEQYQEGGVITPTGTGEQLVPPDATQPTTAPPQVNAQGQDAAEVQRQQRDFDQMMQNMATTPQDQFIAEQKTQTPITVNQIAETNPEGAALLAQAGITSVRADQMAVQYANGEISLVPASDTPPAGATIITYGGASQPAYDKNSDLSLPVPFTGLSIPLPDNALGELAALGLSAPLQFASMLFSPIQEQYQAANVAPTTEKWIPGYFDANGKFTPSGTPGTFLVYGPNGEQREIPVGSEIPEGFTSVAPEGVERRSGQWETSTQRGPVGDFVSNIVGGIDTATDWIPGVQQVQDVGQAAGNWWLEEMAPGGFGGFAAWQMQNPDIVAQVKATGYNGFTGDQAVWERYQADRNTVQRLVDTITTDPSNLIFGGGTASQSARRGARELVEDVARQSDEASTVVQQGSTEYWINQAAQQADQAPVVQAADQAPPPDISQNLPPSSRDPLAQVDRSQVVNAVDTLFRVMSDTVSIPDQAMNEVVDLFTSGGGNVLRVLGQIPLGDGRQLSDVFRTTDRSVATEAPAEIQLQLEDVMGQTPNVGQAVPASVASDIPVQTTLPEAATAQVDTTLPRDIAPVEDRIRRPELATDRPVEDLGVAPGEAAQPSAAPLAVDRPVEDLGVVPEEPSILQTREQVAQTPEGRQARDLIDKWPENLSYLKPQSAIEREAGVGRIGRDFAQRPIDAAEALAPADTKRWLDFIKEYDKALRRKGTGYIERETSRQGEKIWTHMTGPKGVVLEDGRALRRTWEVLLEADNYIRKESRIFAKYYENDAKLPRYAWKRWNYGGEEHTALDTLARSGGEYVPGTDLAEATELAIFHENPNVRRAARADVEARMSAEGARNVPTQLQGLTSPRNGMSTRTLSRDYQQNIARDLKLPDDRLSMDEIGGFSRQAEPISPDQARQIRMPRTGEEGQDIYERDFNRTLAEDRGEVPPQAPDIPEPMTREQALRFRVTRTGEEGQDVYERDFARSLAEDRGEIPPQAPEAPSSGQAFKRSSAETTTRSVPASEYTDGPLYRETGVRDALRFINPDRSDAPFGRPGVGIDEMYFSNNPDISLGQGVNTGVVIELDPRFMVRVNKNKPGWDFDWDNNNSGEFVYRVGPDGLGQDIVDSVRSITFKPNAGKGQMSDAALARERRFIDERMSSAGWTRQETGDGGVRYTPPQRVGAGQDVFERDLARTAIEDIPEQARNAPIPLGARATSAIEAIPMRGPKEEMGPNLIQGPDVESVTPAVDSLVEPEGVSSMSRGDALHAVVQRRNANRTYAAEEVGDSDYLSNPVAERLGRRAEARKEGRAERREDYLRGKSETRVLEMSKRVDPMTREDLESFSIRGRNPGATQIQVLSQKFGDGETLLGRWDRYADEYVQAGRNVEEAEELAKNRVVGDYTVEILSDEMRIRYEAEYRRLLGKKVEDPLTGDMIPRNELDAQIKALQFTLERTKAGKAAGFWRKYDRVMSALRKTFLYNWLTGPRYITTQMVGNAITAGLTGNTEVMREILDPRSIRRAYRTARADGELPTGIFDDVRNGYGLGGNRELTRGNLITRDQVIDDVANSKPGNSLLGKYVPFIADKRIRQMSAAYDQLARESLWAHWMDYNMLAPRKELRDRMLATVPAGADAAEVARIFDAMPQRFSQSDLREAFTDFDAKWVDRNARDWQEALTKTDIAARKEVKRVFFGGTERNADVALKRVVFFHYWASRALPLYTEAIARNPLYLYNYMKMLETMQDDDDLSGTKFFRLMQSPLGYNILIRPDAFLGTFMSLADDAGYEPDGESTLGKLIRKSPVMLNPLVMTAMNTMGVMGDTFGADPIGANKWIGLTQAAIDNVNAQLGLGLEPAGNPQEWLMRHAREFVSGTLDPVTPDWMLDYVPYSDEMAYKENEVRSIIAEIALENGMSLDDPIVQAAMVDPESALYQEAMKRYARQDAIDIAARIIPVSAVLYPKSQYAPPKERTLAIAQERESQQDAGMTTPTPRGSSLMQERDIIAASDEYSRNMQAWQDEYRAIGGPEARAAWTFYNNIRYGSLNQPVVVSGQEWSAGDVAALEDGQRESLADTWASEAGVSDMITQVRDEREAFRESHPEYDAYVTWSAQLNDYEGGPQQWAVDAAAGNPNYARWYNDLSEDEKTNDIILTGLPAYMAFSGDQMMYWEAAPDATRTAVDPTPYNPLGTGSGDGSSSATTSGTSQETGPTQEKIIEQYQQYEADLAAYNAAASQMLGQEVNVDWLNPQARQAVVYNLSTLGFNEPYIGGYAYDYLQWVNAQQGGDTSIPAYLAWYAKMNPAQQPVSSVVPVSP